MANVRITDLSAVATGDLTDSDVMIVDDVDAVPKVSYKVTIAQLRTEFASPSSNGGESSGTSALRWSTVYGQAGDFSTTLAVGGAATLSSTLAVTGNVTVNTNKFTVAAASGNTAVAGTLAVTGATTLSAGIAGTTATFSGAISGSSVTASGSVVAGANSNIEWSGRSKLYTGTDGNIVLGNNASDGFSLLQFGGTTSSFPALKRSSATLQVRLADDSDYAALTAAAITGTTGTFSSNLSAAAISGTTGTFSSTLTANALVSTTSVTAGANSNIEWSGRSKLYTGTDGNIVLGNSASDGFSLLQFGGITSSFPALKRSSATLQVRLADDSDYAAFRAGAITGSSFTGDLTGNVTGDLTGDVTGNVTGNVTGSSGSCTGNAATATALQTARTINGTSFDGTGNITVTAAAGTLTGNTLAAGVTASSLTSVGTLTSLSVGAITSTGLLQTTLTTEQMRLSYDADSYMSVTVGSSAIAVFETQESSGPVSSGFDFKHEGSLIFTARSIGGLTPGIGFYGTAAVAKQTVTGSRGGNAALASLISALATLGLVTDSTS